MKSARLSIFCSTAGGMLSRSSAASTAAASKPHPSGVSCDQQERKAALSGSCASGGYACAGSKHARSGCAGETRSSSSAYFRLMVVNHRTYR